MVCGSAAAAGESMSRRYPQYAPTRIERTCSAVRKDPLDSRTRSMSSRKPVLSLIITSVVVVVVVLAAVGPCIASSTRTVQTRAHARNDPSPSFSSSSKGTTNGKIRPVRHVARRGGVVVGDCGSARAPEGSPADRSTFSLQNHPVPFALSLLWSNQKGCHACRSNGRGLGLTPADRKPIPSGEGG
jgi:hypothetical protein